MLAQSSMCMHVHKHVLALPAKLTDREAESLLGPRLHYRLPTLCPAAYTRFWRHKEPTSSRRATGADGNAVLQMASSRPVILPAFPANPALQPSKDYLPTLLHFWSRPGWPTFAQARPPFAHTFLRASH
jgi:hypothetical protein